MLAQMARRKVLLIHIFSSHRDYSSEQTLPCMRSAPSSVVWSGFSLPRPELKHLGRSSAGLGMLCPREEAAATGRSLLRAGLAPGARAWAPLDTSVPRPPRHPEVLSMHVQIMLLMLFVFGNFSKLSDLD